MISEINLKTLKEWLPALRTQYQIRGDAIVPRDSMDAPTVEQMSCVRAAHYSIIPLIEHLIQFYESAKSERSDEYALRQAFERAITVHGSAAHGWETTRHAADKNFYHKMKVQTAWEICKAIATRETVQEAVCHYNAVVSGELKLTDIEDEARK